MIRFSAKRDVAISPQMKAIEKQKQWLEFVTHLRTMGYTEAQIRFILADTPQLLIDGNRNGTPDLLEVGDSTSPRQPAKPNISASPQHDNAPRQRMAYTAHAIVREGDGYEVEVMGPQRPNGQRPDNRAHQSE